MTKKLLLSISIFLILTSLMLVKPAKVQACGETCYCASSEECKHKPYQSCYCSGHPHKCVCQTGYLCVSGTCQKAHKECVNGSCQDVIGSGSNQCSDNCDCKCCDTDGGQNIWVKGTACAINPAYPGGKNCGTDVCVTDGFTLVEYYCGLGGYPLLTRNDCRGSNAVCQDGRCVVPAGPTPTSPPVPTPTPSASCDTLCKQNPQYSGGICRRDVTVIGGKGVVPGCLSSEISIGQDNCNSGSRCCCTVIPTPTPRPPTPTSRPTATPTPRPTPTPTPTPRSTPTPTPRPPTPTSTPACTPPQGPALNQVNQSCQTSGTYVRNFSWNTPVGTQPFSYRFEISTNSNYANPTPIEAGASTQVSNVSLRTGTTYYWRVRAQNACGCFYGTQYDVSSGYSNSCSVLGETLELWLTPTPVPAPCSYPNYCTYSFQCLSSRRTSGTCPSLFQVCCRR